MYCTLRMIPQRTCLCSYISIHHFASDAQQNNTPAAYLNSNTELTNLFFTLPFSPPICLQMEESHFAL